MPDYSFQIYTLGSLSGVEEGAQTAFNMGGTEPFTGTPVTISVSDDDPYLEDYAYVEAPQSPETGDPGVLIDPVTIAGQTFAAGTPIYAISQVQVSNDTTGESGWAQIVTMGATSSSFKVVAYPFMMNPGDQITVIPTNNSAPGGERYGDSQGYFYSQMVSEPPAAPPCFTNGTLIQTKAGLIAMEDLRPGDMVQTVDNGFQPLVWKYERKFTAKWFQMNQNKAPITLREGALGAEREVTVSPGHMVLVGDELVPAKFLLNGDIAYRDVQNDRSYIHLLFENHQVLQTHGFKSESFMPSYSSLSNLGAERREVFEIFPQLSTPSGWDAYKPARNMLFRKQAKAAIAAVA